MADMKKLVLVIESTSALAPHWRTIFSDYLDKIIRTFCGDEQKTPDTPIAELTLVSFNARETDTNLAQRSSWTTDVEVFMEWLSALSFSDGDLSCDHAAIAEGLAEVLMMFPSVHGNQNLQRHCILVSASNPYPLPTPVYIPPDYLGMRIENHSSDAETVAKYFKQCLISLSVICPYQLPKLRAIYNAAKWNPLETDLTIDIGKNHLVLISQNFMEAHAALSQPQITKLPSDGQSPIVDLSQEEDSSPPTFVGNIPDPDTIKEPAANTSSEISWEDIISWYEDIVQLDPTPAPVVVVPTESTVVTATVLQPKLGISGISGILNNLSHSRLLGPGNPNISNMITRACITSTSSEQPALPDYVATNVGPAQQTLNALVFDPSRSYYEKLWEGVLSTVDRQGQPFLIARLQGFRNAKDSNQSLAKDWPSTMQIDRLIPEAEIKRELMNFTGKVDYLVFEAASEHFFLKRMQLNKLCMVIMLPSQLLTLFIKADKETTFLGRVINKENVRYKPPKQPYQEQQQGQAPWQGQQSMSSSGSVI